MLVCYLFSDLYCQTAADLNDNKVLVQQQCIACASSQDSVTLVGNHNDMFKRSISSGEVWESPRAPFEVLICLRTETGNQTGTVQ